MNNQRTERRDPLLAATPEEETVLACLRLVNADHRKQLVSCALGLVLVIQQHLDEDLVTIHWSTHGEGVRFPTITPLMRCYAEARERIESGEYLHPM